jgi:hypothetical protein
LSATGDLERGAVVVDDDDVLRIGVFDVKETFLELALDIDVRPEGLALEIFIVDVALVLGIGADLDKGEGEKISSMADVSE